MNSALLDSPRKRKRKEEILAKLSQRSNPISMIVARSHAASASATAWLYQEDSKKSKAKASAILGTGFFLLLFIPLFEILFCFESFLFVEIVTWWYFVLNL